MQLSINKNSYDILQKNFRRLFSAGVVLSTLFFSSAGTLQAQWSNNPQVNRIFVSNTKNPYNITTSIDGAGGGFIFWEDKIDSAHTNIFFQHFNEDGEVSFRTDGKPVSTNRSSRSFPVSAISEPNSAVVFFKDFSDGKQGEVYSQKVSSKGELLWGQPGIRVTNQEAGILELAAAGDDEGNSFVTYIYRDYSTPADYIIYIQKLNPSGKTSFKANGLVVTKSTAIKSRPQIVSDTKGGAYIFWVESSEGKTRLFSQHVNSSGRNTWNNGRPVIVSASSENVINYITAPVGTSEVYTAWEIKKSGRDILQQLISIDGRLQWNKSGEHVSSRSGDQTSPQAISTDSSSVTLTFVNESMGDKDIYIQKYSLKGQPLWMKDGVPVIKMKGSQMSQRIISDRSQGTIVAWLDKRSKVQKGNILAQRINKDGRLLWDSLGVALASNPNSEKSYLNLIPNKGKSIAAIFKENRSSLNSILGQRILSNGRYSFEISGLNATVDNNLAHVSWQTNNEVNNKGFYVERSIGSDNSWERIKFIPAKNQKGMNTYDFSEKIPGGTEVYYRLLQVDNDGDYQKSGVTKLNFFSFDAESYALAQNFPNPFSDSTIIKYNIPEDSDVRVEVYSDKIETIAVPVDEFETKGEHSFTFHSDGNYGRLPGGIYFYRMKAGEFVDVKKMIIIR